MRLLTLAALVAFVAAGCTSTTSGSGTAQSSSSSRSPSAAPPSSVAGTTGPTAPTTPSAAAPSGRPLTVTGTATGTTYRAVVYGSDDITDCAAHAYGQQMITFLTQHPCRGAHRVIATVPLGGRTVAVSVISTSFASPDPKAPFAIAGQFTKMELANCSCGLNDLLREGGVIPGVSGGIPATEAFTVLGQDTGVAIFDSWYVDGTTKDQDPALVALQKDLFLSELVSA